MRSIFRLSADASTHPVARTRSIPQGDPAAPAIFNVTVDDCGAMFLGIARDRGWGVELSPGKERLSSVLFADNFWLFSNSAE
eukprot:13660491-Alexandrium_andersonii.AAC.1